MKKLLYLSISCALIAFLSACTASNTEKGGINDSDSIEQVVIPDTAIYGIIDESTTMHMLTVKMEDGKTVTLSMNTDSIESDIQGGLFAGDKVTLTAVKGSEEPAVRKLVNLSSLLGKWTSLARNFQIMENGVVESNASAETNPYTQWQMSNAQIILNNDTFDVLSLGADSMALENSKGIFVYKRQR